MEDGPEKTKEKAEIAEKEAQIKAEDVEVSKQRQDKIEEDKLAVDAEDEAQSEGNSTLSKKIDIEKKQVEVAQMKEEEIDEEKRKVQEEGAAVNELPDGGEKDVKQEQVDSKLSELDKDEAQAKDEETDAKDELASLEAKDQAEKEEDEDSEPPSDKSEELKAVIKEHERSIAAQEKEVGEKEEKLANLPDGAEKDGLTEEIAKGKNKISEAKLKLETQKDSAVKIAGDKEKLKTETKAVESMPPGPMKEAAKKALEEKQAKLETEIASAIGDNASDTAELPDKESSEDDTENLPKQTNTTGLNTTGLNTTDLPPSLKKLVKEKENEEQDKE